MVTDEWGHGTATVGRRAFLNGSDYYQPLIGPDLSEDARALDMSACYNRRLLWTGCTFSPPVAEVFYAYALVTQRPWGLQQPWAITQRRTETVPSMESLITELVQRDFWLRAGGHLRLADADDLLAYWRWFDAERRRRRAARNLGEEQRHRILVRDGHRCVFCGSETSLVIDHVIPVAEGGGKDDRNLRTLCRVCNAGRNLPHPPRSIYPGARDRLGGEDDME